MHATIYRSERCQSGKCRAHATGWLYNPDGVANPNGLRCAECGKIDADYCAAVEEGWRYVAAQAVTQ